MRKKYSRIFKCLNKPARGVLESRSVRHVYSRPYELLSTIKVAYALITFVVAIFIVYKLFGVDKSIVFSTFGNIPKFPKFKKKS